ncbi:hypothetical protein HK100_012043 [Physocladia obscura]|uniref:Uncharacterized protein n=1 Tax=Physocladia obscura TaxID=109957 RepID=A0AAD5XG74_9FUNG|nr:hypothetical protein HK100_012043 [Physocladia obscura]
MSENDIYLDALNTTRDTENVTIQAVLDAIEAEQGYSILLWGPFVVIPACILGARLIKYLYKLHQSHIYGYDEDLLDDPLRQLGLDQLGLSLNRGYEDLNDIRKIRKEQKKIASTETEKQSFAPEFITRPLYLAENYLAAFHLQTQKTWADHLSPEAVRRWFEDSSFGRFWMMFQVFCTLVSIVNYVFLTYTIQNEERTFIKSLDVLLAAIFLADYSISLYIAEDRLAFYFNYTSFVDLISIIPPFIYLFVGEHTLFIWFLGLLRILRASRILRTYRLLSFSESEEKREITIVALTFCNFIFLSTSVINALETINITKKTEASLTNWHDALYYIMVTFSTIGFGDLTPSSTASRIVVMILIVFVIIYVPIQTNRISEIYSASSPFQRARYVPSKLQSHVIVSGSITYGAILDFTKEFFASDNHSKIIILAQSEPSIDIRKLLRHPMYRSRMRYLSGSALSASDLKRAGARNATGLFLINEPIEKTGTFGATIQEDEQIRVTRGADAEILMQALVAKKMCPGLPVFVEVLDIRSEDLSAHCGCDRVICSDKYKMGILARECMVPGFLTLVLNMICKYSNERSKLQETEPWLYEYSLGASNQIYSFRIPPGLNNVKWDEAAESIFKAFNVTVFAVMSLSGPQTGKLRLNPGKSYTLRGDDILFCLTSGGGEVVLRLSIQFKDAVPRAQLEMLELEMELNETIAPLNNAVNLGSADSISEKFESNENTSSVDGNTLVDHVVLCGHITARGIRHFVTSFRKAEQDLKSTIGETYSPVKIVCLLEEHLDKSKTNISDKDPGIWSDILSDGQVVLIKGTPLKKTSLILCGIEKCKRVVIFSTPVSSNMNTENAHVLPDANSIFIIKMIQEEWPAVNFMVELVSGANVRYFSATSRALEWDTDNLRMQSILNNYSLSVTDRISLYKKIRQVSTNSDGFFNRLYQFIWPTNSPSSEIKIKIGSKKYLPLATFKQALAKNISELKDDASIISTASTKPILKLPTKYHSSESASVGSIEIGGGAEEEEEEEDCTNDSVGKGSSSVSAAYLQKLVEEAELDESGVSPSLDHHFDRNFAMGRVAPVSFLHSMLVQSYFRPYLGAIISALSSSVTQIRVPAKLSGHKYSELFSYLLRHDLVTLGLYRLTNRSIPSLSSALSPGKTKATKSVFAESESNKTKYVYTNCRGFDLVYQDDLVFVVPASQ